jgi:hypothetical protein
MFMREPILPVALTLQDPFVKSKEITGPLDTTWVQKKVDNMLEIFNQVRERQRHVAERNAARINQDRINSNFFKLGDQVLWFKTDRRVGDTSERTYHYPQSEVPKKWQLRSTGPHEVVGYGDYQTVIILDKDNKEKKYVKANPLHHWGSFEDLYNDPPTHRELPLRPKLNAPVQTLRRSHPQPGDLCLIHFPECAEEPYAVAKYMGLEQVSGTEPFELYQWYSQYPTPKLRQDRKSVPLSKRKWYAGWYDNAKAYFPKDSRRQYFRDKEYTNIETWETIAPEQILTFQFELNKDRTLPKFILDLVNAHRDQKTSPKKD